jgi:hypothetical protein
MTQPAKSKRTVFAASSGCYSDYSVVAIFERRADAEEFVAAGMAEDVEEMDYFSEMPPVYTVYTVWISKQGGSWGQAGALNSFSNRTTDEPKHETDETPRTFKAVGPDKERCIKSVRDRYAAWKARREGVS